MESWQCRWRKGDEEPHASVLRDTNLQAMSCKRKYREAPSLGESHGLCSASERALDSTCEPGSSGRLRQLNTNSDNSTKTQTTQLKLRRLNRYSDDSVHFLTEFWWMSHVCSFTQHDLSSCCVTVMSCFLPDSLSAVECLQTPQRIQTVPGTTL